MKRTVLAILIAMTLAVPLTSYESIIAGAEEAAFEEITVVDNDECVIRITGLEPDSLFGYTVDAYFENKSSEKTYMFSVETASVNGVMSDPFFATEVAAGKKDNSDITFYSMPDVIEEVTDIEISFRVYDSDDWSAEDVVNETITVTP